MSESAEQNQVFISYASRDGAAFATRLNEQLKQAGFTTWFYQERARVTYDANALINSADRLDALRSSFALIAVLTPGAFESDNVREEWTTAAPTVPIIPVIFQPVSLKLTEPFLDFTDQFAQPWEDLFSSVEYYRREGRDTAGLADQLINESWRIKQQTPPTRKEVRTGNSPPPQAASKRQTIISSAEPEPEPEPDPVPPPALSRPGIGYRQGMGNDRIGREDQLNFVHYVKAFADLIESTDTQPPITIGIFGSWGAGKSFLLENITNLLEKRRVERVYEPVNTSVVQRVHVVTFNAWEYNATEVIWPGLVRKIMRELEQNIDFGFFGNLRSRIKHNFKRQWEQNRSRLIGRLIVSAVLLAIVVIIARTLNLGDLTVAGQILITLAGGLLALINVARDAIFNPISEWITALFEESNYGKQIGYMEDIAADLRYLERKLNPLRGGKELPEHEKQRVLIIIDDLDRCEPTKAVEVLQAINLLLSFKSFIVILGIDARIVTGAINKYYANLLDEAGASGYEYLDKIIQIPFRIPASNEAELREFIRMQMIPAAMRQQSQSTTLADDTQPIQSISPDNSAAGKDEPQSQSTTQIDETSNEPDIPPVQKPYQDVPEDFSDDELAHFQEMSGYLRANPRHVKRLINVYRLVRSLAWSKGEDLILGDTRKVIRWLVVCSQWSYTSHAMMRCYDEANERIAENLLTKPTGDARLWLWNRVKDQLDPALRDKMDDDPDALRQLLSDPNGSLEWDEVGTIRKYTINFNPAVETLAFSTDKLNLKDQVSEAPPPPLPFT